MFDGTLEFIAGLTTTQMINYFWPFFLLDMLRYVLLDFLIILKYIPKRLLARKKYARARKLLHKEKPLVSVIVPGKNEGKHIPRLAQTLARQTYKNFELIVVDDGSDDGSATICRELVHEGVIDFFIRNEVRGGKASAANTALHYASGKFIVHIDADSYMDIESIERILLPFYLDQNIGAVGGDVRVANLEESFATRLQGIEYIKSLSTGRTVSSELGILRIISGAHGAFRRDVLDQIYGWDVGPGLDGDITLKIRKLGYKVVHEPFSICYTNVPTTFRKLARQRFRWDKSLVRFRVRKHRDVLLPSAEFKLTNFIASAENIFFNLALDFKWWVYLVQMITFHPDILGFIFVINYVLYFCANVLEYLMAGLLLRSSLRRREFNLILFLPLVPIYTGVYLRIVRTFSYLMEFLHRSSYTDQWNPWKVSRVARKENL